MPLVVIHGGPGYPHDYLEPLEDLADEHQVIFYDQLGCGNSDHTADPPLWTISHFVAELELLIKSLNIERYALLGQSWGAALALAFASSAERKGLQKIVFADPYISSAIWQRDALRLAKKLSWKDRYAIRTGKEGSPGFIRATNEYNHRFVYGMDTLPEACERSGQKMNVAMYRHMWGPTEFIITGTLKHHEPLADLAKIRVPALFICGRNDEATPEACAYFASLMPQARTVVLEKSAHHAHWTERDAYMQAVQSFLR